MKRTLERPKASPSFSHKTISWVAIVHLLILLVLATIPFFFRQKPKEKMLEMVELGTAAPGAGSPSGQVQSSSSGGDSSPVKNAQASPPAPAPIQKKVEPKPPVREVQKSEPVQEDAKVEKAEPKPLKVEPKVEKAEPKPLKVEPKVEKAEPKPVKVEPKVEKAEPKPFKVEPKVEKVEPKPVKVEPKVEKVEPKPVKVEPRVEKVEPKPVKAEPKVEKMEPKPAKVEPKIEKVQPKVEKVEPNLTKALSEGKNPESKQTEKITPTLVKTTQPSSDSGNSGDGKKIVKNPIKVDLGAKTTRTVPGSTSPKAVDMGEQSGKEEGKVGKSKDGVKAGTDSGKGVAPDAKGPSASDIRSKLSSAVGVEGGKGQGALGSSNGDAYNALIKRTLTGNWVKPTNSKSDLKTKVKIRVKPDGTVEVLGISLPSGDSAMDQSVLEAVRSTGRLNKALPEGLGTPDYEVIVNFQLD